MSAADPCQGCQLRGAGALAELGLEPGGWDHLVALAGNPNTGKSTVFNALTGLRQHTGNWPGKTVARAEGTCFHGGRRLNVVDLPGTYSLQAGSVDEEVARDFILFGRPDVTVVVVDATRLERNLNLALQILEITNRVVVCLNLIDEAERRGIAVNARTLASRLGVPVIPAAARSRQGIPQLLAAIDDVAIGRTRTKPFRIPEQPPEIESAVRTLVPLLEEALPDLPNARWVALRLLNGDRTVEEGVLDGEIGFLQPDAPGDANAEPPSRRTGTAVADRRDARAEVLRKASELRWRLTPDFHDAVVERIFDEAHAIAAAAVSHDVAKASAGLDRRLDRLLTSRIFGFPMMLAVLAGVFWITIAGANVPSRLLSGLLIDTVLPALHQFGEAVGMPWWLSGFLFDGVYLATAWVVSVMLPPMAIFFPLFTLLEDFGYLPRVAFNLDSLFRRVGAHGKQALTMSMGYGCNAAGVVAARIIDSPRERLIAIITNNFSLCNGRWPTQILLASVFLAAAVPAPLAGLVSATAVVAVALLGILFVFLTSWLLSSTVLKGEATTFSLELPPYRPPRVLQTLYTSLIDRTLIVLWRAVAFAAPAGAVIWLVSNVEVAGASIAQHLVSFLDPFGVLIGLNGIILLAYVVAIPANEIVIPTVLMLTVKLVGISGVGAGAGVMFEMESSSAVGGLLAAGGWTLLTAVNLMLFSLLHNPCSTTIYTIWKETRSARWTAVSTFLPLAMGITLTFLVAQAWRLVAP